MRLRGFYLRALLEAVHVGLQALSVLGLHAGELEGNLVATGLDRPRLVDAAQHLRLDLDRRRGTQIAADQRQGKSQRQVGVQRAVGGTAGSTGADVDRHEPEVGRDVLPGKNLDLQKSQEPMVSPLLVVAHAFSDPACIPRWYRPHPTTKSPAVPTPWQPQHCDSVLSVR